MDVEFGDAVDVGGVSGVRGVSDSVSVTRSR